MLGHSYFGAAYFGGSYFGPAAGPAVLETSALRASITRYPRFTASISRNPMGTHYKVGSTNTVRVKGPQNKDTRIYLDGLATVTLVGLFDSNNVAVAGTTGINIPYVSGVGRSALYLGTVPHTAPLVDGATYTERVTIVDVGGNVLQEDTSVTAVS